jgi:hypothetical protein
VLTSVALLPAMRVCACSDPAGDRLYRAGDGPGARRSTVWTVKARMGAVRALGRQLKDSGIEMVTLESTSDYVRSEGA